MHDTSKQSLDSTEGLKVNTDEPPPSYSPLDGQASGSSSPSVTFKTKPTNYLALSNDNDTIRGEFVIDPSISIPSSMLPPLCDSKTEEDRENLSLKSKNGSVHADIWLLGPSGDTKIDPRRTTISLLSSNGSISAEVRTLNNAAPFSLTGRTSNGAIRLALPRSFEGLITVSTRNGSIHTSDEIIQNATQLGQLDATQRFFVGDFQLLGEEPWQGDQVEVEAPNGSIRVKYVDDLADSQGKKGFLSRLFGK